MGTAIRLQNVLLRNSKKIILDFRGQTIEIGAGEKVALLGENGAGKTSLVNCLINESDYSGTIKNTFLPNDIGIVFQENNYSELIKVGELVRLVTGMKKNSPAFRDFMQQFSLTHLTNNYVEKLSGGEKQRLTLALVLNQDKKLYFFDEITSGLDFEKRQNLLKTMKKLTSDKTVIQITHYFEDIENWADRLLLLHEGKLLFNGSVNDFLKEFIHYSMIAVPLKLSDELDFDNSFTNDSELIIYTNDENEHKNTIHKLNNLAIEFNFKLQSIDSSYLLAIRGENNE